MPRVILHVDLDAFFASVEELDRPELAGLPVVVGGTSGRGVVAAASYAARAFGIRSAMPIVEAQRRCPDLVVIPPSRHRYEALSAQVFQIFESFTPLVEGLSIDEAFLDVTSSQSLFGDGEAIARAIKQRVRSEVGLVASAGVATCKFIAKVASALHKPDGLVVVRPGNEEEFVSRLPVERMWGLGPASSGLARRHGFSNLGDLARAKDGDLLRIFGSHGPTMGALARGQDARPVTPNVKAKSIGAEETFASDLHRSEEVRVVLLRQCEQIAQRLRKGALGAERLSIKIRFGDFQTVTRQGRLAEPTSDTPSLYALALELLARIEIAKPIRLCGVSAHSLIASDSRPRLFPDTIRERDERIEDAIATLRDRYGPQALGRAALIGRRKLIDSITGRTPEGARVGARARLPGLKS